ncbi:hypothetical protein KGQ29_00850 [Patescibacteria group bacterium]|nr:hypothetical protein [Patescibacteria group bacterium]
MGICFLVLLPAWWVFANDTPLTLMLPFMFYGIILLLNSRKKIEADHKTTARNLELVLATSVAIVFLFFNSFARFLGYFFAYFGFGEGLGFGGALLISMLSSLFFVAAVILGLLRLKRNKYAKI